MKKNLFFIGGLAAIALTAFLGYNHYFNGDAFYFLKGTTQIDTVSCTTDKDNDGVVDADDIAEGARKEVLNRTEYKSVYYNGGYPPDSEGVCTDVVWRALKNAGFDLKTLMDADIKGNTKDYPGVVGAPDPNIDFRRVKNQYAFFKKYATSLTLEVVPYDKSNLTEWQRGDIVVIRDTEHIAIVSDKRKKDGVPYILHNASTYAKEEDRLLRWSQGHKIIGHFRYPK